jgi:hypothetical protein
MHLRPHTICIAHMRYTPVRCTLCEVHAHETLVYERHPYERHPYERHPYEMHATRGTL